VSDDIDPERVGRAAAEVADVDFRAMGEKDAILAELTDAERQVVAKASALIAVSMLRDVDVLKDPPTIMDATNRQLKAVAAVWGVLARWDVSLDLDRRLSDQLKILPHEDAELIMRFLRWGGLAADA
jgi:hypothetical protein